VKFGRPSKLSNFQRQEAEAGPGRARFHSHPGSLRGSDGHDPERSYAGTRWHLPSPSGRKACSPGIIERIL
jgi:hypothetical protein